jgi:tripartite-type tricarboxylate transporter receptor subunit TctC
MKAHGYQGYWSRIAVLCLLAVPAISSAYAQAGNYPEKAVTIISDAGAGASVDVGTRIIAESLGKIWGQGATVVNHPGANGSIAARAASEATGDGYTLYTPASSTFVALPTVAPNLPVKLPRDFLPIGFLADQPLFLAVNPASGIASVRELVDRAKKEPGTISVAVSGVGRMTHLTSIMLQQQAGITLIPGPYTGGPSAALADVFSGRVAMIIEGYAGIIGAVTAGQVKLIATTAAHRLAEFPELPTVAESIPGVAASGWVMMAAPLRTPAPIIAKVSADLNKVVNDPDVKKKLATIGSYVHPMTPGETQAFVDKQQATWLPVLQKISTP